MGTVARRALASAVFWGIVTGFSGLVLSGPQDETSESVKNMFALLEVYTSRPFLPSSAMPDHLWMETGKGRVVFLHFDKPIADPSARVIFAGDGISGRFCAEDQPEGGTTGFVHFHRAQTPHLEISHGGRAGEEGYWLRHVAVAEFDMMDTHFTVGTAMNFMPTIPPRCGAS